MSVECIFYISKYFIFILISMCRFALIYLLMNNVLK